jgi:hypothetical protein
MTIRADRREILKARSHLPLQPAQWQEVVRFRELRAELTVNVLEAKPTHLTLVVVANLALGRQKPAPLALQVRCHALPIFKLGIYLALFVLSGSVRQCAGHILKESYRSRAKMRVYFVRSLSRLIIDAIECPVRTVLFENWITKL